MCWQLFPPHQQHHRRQTVASWQKSHHCLQLNYLPKQQPNHHCSGHSHLGIPDLRLRCCSRQPDCLTLCHRNCNAEEKHHSQQNHLYCHTRQPPSRRHSNQQPWVCIGYLWWDYWPARWQLLGCYTDHIFVDKFRSCFRPASKRNRPPTSRHLRALLYLERIGCRLCNSCSPGFLPQSFELGHQNVGCRYQTHHCWGLG